MLQLLSVITGFIVLNSGVCGHRVTEPDQFRKTARMPTQVLRDSVHDYLLHRGPATAEEIHRSLVAEGTCTHKTAQGVKNALSASPGAFQRPDGRWDLTTNALAGVVLTVRPRSRLRDNVLWVHEDLAPFDSLLVGRRIPLAQGGVAELGGGQIRTLVGPEGWLPDVPPGSLLALKWTGAALELFPAQLSPEDEDVSDLHALLQRHAMGLQAPYARKLHLTSVVLSALREDPDCLSRPRPPLSEILPWSSEDISDASPWRADRDAQRLTLLLPSRVYDELARRAGLLGEHIGDHASVLLGAAVDRVRIDVSDRYANWNGWGDYYDDLDTSVVTPLRHRPY